VFANGGYRIEPYIVAKDHTTSSGKVLAQRASGALPATSRCARSTRATPS
jgi:membrane carboxypeptidase/penicillin-binding protein